MGQRSTASTKALRYVQRGVWCVKRLYNQKNRNRNRSGEEGEDACHHPALLYRHAAGVATSNSSSTRRESTQQQQHEQQPSMQTCKFTKERLDLSNEANILCRTEPRTGRDGTATAATKQHNRAYPEAWHNDGIRPPNEEEYFIVVVLVN